MPLSSSVIKANQVKINGSVYRLQLCGTQEAVEVGEPSVNEGSLLPEQRPESQLLEEARTAAAEIVAAAQSERDEILAAAGQLRDELLRKAAVVAEAQEEEAKRRGYDSGYLEGLAEGRQEGNLLRRKAEEFYEETMRLREEMLSRVEPQVVELAVAVAERFVGTQLATHPETVVSVVREALRQLKETGEVMVRLHPEDLPLCKMQLSELKAEIREQSTLNLFADAELERGNCRVETNGAVVECLLDERFSALRTLLADVTADG